MLLLADRNFYSYRLWRAAAGTGAELLWRVPGCMHLPVVRELPRVSWLTHINDPRAVHARLAKNGQRRRRGSPLGPETGPLPGITVRVIEFVLAVSTSDGAVRTERYRLITTVTGWQALPAAELAACYARRWAIETGFAELKTCPRGPGRLLRGRTPDLARQELWAYLAIYQALRTLITRAAARDGTDPGRISFTAALHAVQRTMTVGPASRGAALDATDTEISSCLIPRREGRISPRAVKATRAAYASRNSHPGPLSQHATYTTTITTRGAPTQTITDQPGQSANDPDNPP